jgi:protein ImuB
MAQRRLLSLQPCAPGDLPALALWCQRYTPLTAIDPPEGVILDITGCAHLFGGEVRLQAQILRRLPGARLAIADTAAAAWGVARYAAPGAEDFLSLPLAALRLEADTEAKLRRVGVRKVADLQRLPRAGLVAGYGTEPALRLAQALGEAPEALRFYAAPPQWREVEHYAEPILLPAQLQAALQRLSAKLCDRLGLAARGAMSLCARFYRIDLHCPEIILRFASPCRDPAQIAKLLVEKLAREVDPGFGIEALSLEAGATEFLAPVQQDIVGGEVLDSAKTLNTLLNRLGAGKLWRAVPHASYIPEYAVLRAAVTSPPEPWTKPPHPRPVRLLPRPASITAIAPVPDDPPVQFTWEGRVHRVCWATGPERIARDWWCHAPDATRPEAEKIRDYYVVEDRDGARFWLFRAGLHDGVAPARWYLHGFFA